LTVPVATIGVLPPRVLERGGDVITPTEPRSLDPWSVREIRLGRVPPLDETPALRPRLSGHGSAEREPPTTARRQADRRVGLGVSSVGDFLLWGPLTLHLQRTTGSGIAVAALFVALWTPVVVLAPVAGLLVDRLEARAVLIVASLAQAAVAASLAFTLDSVAAILILAVMLGSASPSPSRPSSGSYR